MVPLLRDLSRAWKNAAFNIWAGSTSMRTARYRLTRYHNAVPKGNRYQLPGSGRYELYDYQADPAGNENLAVDPGNRELLDKLIAQMDAELHDRIAKPPAAPAAEARTAGDEH